MDLVVEAVVPGTPRGEDVLALADRVLDQRRHLLADRPHTLTSHILGAFEGDACLGFVRYVVQIIGADDGRPPVVHRGSTLTEGFVEALGVDPDVRRRGVASALQAEVQDRCRAAGCYQVRSRSPMTSVENYALKLESGYALHPSNENDSYYFLLKL